MEKQKAMFKPPMIERRIGGSLWVYESNREKQAVESMLADERLKHRYQDVSIKKVFADSKGRRCVEFAYAPKSKAKNSDIEKLDRKIWDIKFYILRQDVKRSLKKK